MLSSSGFWGRVSGAFSGGFWGAFSGRVPPYQSAIRWWAIETGPGRRTRPARTSPASSRRVNQRTRAISVPSGRAAPGSATTARKPSISERGKGQGWEPRYSARTTLTPASSPTSRATAASRLSPASTKPAKVE
ncbi:Uncharacterised protein [Mycobacteroides abscessus subsp. abscessus]|nr:Uncharacterised protein [Mycobacteroides abscessus subsp. abscessus]